MNGTWKVHVWRGDAWLGFFTDLATAEAWIAKHGKPGDRASNISPRTARELAPKQESQ